MKKYTKVFITLMVTLSAILSAINLSMAMKQQEKYTVFYLRGNIFIENKGTNKRLQVGDRIKDTTKLIAKSANIAIEIVSNISGSCLLDVKKINNKQGIPVKNLKKAQSTNDFILLLKNLLFPSQSSLGSKGNSREKKIDIIESKKDFAQFFSKKRGQKKPNILLGTAYLLISQEAYPLFDPKNFFFITYEYNSKTIEKKLKSKKSTIILDRDIYKHRNTTIDPKKIPTRIQLYYTTTTVQGANKREKICRFMPIVFPNETILKNEIRALLSGIKGSKISAKPNNRRKIIASFLNEFYGIPYESNLTRWLENNFGQSI